MSIGFALRYAGLGWKVIPVDAQERPLVVLTDATDDIAQIREWWWMWPNAGVAVVLRPSSLAAVVAETEKGRTLWTREHRKLFGEPDQYPLMKTSRGYVAFFRVKSEIVDKRPYGDLIILTGLSFITLPPRGGAWITSPFIVKPPYLPRSQRFWPL